MLFSGYRGHPELTAAAMDGAWFVTSDLGLIGTDGRLAVRGRADDVIITGGEKVVAGEVAALLETCPGVREAAVVGRPDAEWGERVTAVIVPDNPAQPPTLDLLCRHVQERLPRLRSPPGARFADGDADAAERQTRSRNAPPGTIPGPRTLVDSARANAETQRRGPLDEGA